MLNLSFQIQESGMEDSHVQESDSNFSKIQRFQIQESGLEDSHVNTHFVISAC